MPVKTDVERSIGDALVLTLGWIQVLLALGILTFLGWHALHFSLPFVGVGPVLMAPIYLRERKIRREADHGSSVDSISVGTGGRKSTD